MPEEKKRLFFALWPSASMQLEIHQRVKQALGDRDGRVVAPNNLHITLAYIGHVDAATQTCLMNAATHINAQPFCLTLAGLGFWPKPRVVWLGVENPPVTLMRLQEALVEALGGCGYKADKRSYLPHMTLKRKVRSRPLPVSIEPLTWVVQRFVLVHSQTWPQGVQYQVVHEWSLTS